MPTVDDDDDDRWERALKAIPPEVVRLADKAADVARAAMAEGRRARETGASDLEEKWALAHKAEDVAKWLWASTAVEAIKAHAALKRTPEELCEKELRIIVPRGVTRQNLGKLKILTLLAQTDSALSTPDVMNKVDSFLREAIRALDVPGEVHNRVVEVPKLQEALRCALHLSVETPDRDVGIRRRAAMKACDFTLSEDYWCRKGPQQKLLMILAHAIDTKTARKLE